MPEGPFTMSYISLSQPQPSCRILQCSAMVELKVSLVVDFSTRPFAFWLITFRCSMAASKLVSLQQYLSRNFYRNIKREYGFLVPLIGSGTGYYREGSECDHQHHCRFCFVHLFAP